MQNIILFGNILKKFVLFFKNKLSKNVNDYESPRKDNLLFENKRFQTLFDMAPDGIMTINAFGTITSANAAYYELTGYSEEEIV